MANVRTSTERTDPLPSVSKNLFSSNGFKKCVLLTQRRRAIRMKSCSNPKENAPEGESSEALVSVTH